MANVGPEISWESGARHEFVIRTVSKFLRKGESFQCIRSLSKRIRRPRLSGLGRLRGEPSVEELWGKKRMWRLANFGIGVEERCLELGNLK